MSLYMWRDRGVCVCVCVCRAWGVFEWRDVCVCVCEERDGNMEGEKRVLVCVGVYVWRVECVGALEEEKWVCVCEGNIDLEYVCVCRDWGMGVRESQGYRRRGVHMCVYLRMERQGCMGVEKTLYMRREVERVSGRRD